MNDEQRPPPGAKDPHTATAAPVMQIDPAAAGRLLRDQLKDVYAAIAEIKAGQAELMAYVREVEIGRLRNIGYAGQYEALQQTAAFASRHMHKVATFADPIATLDHALSLAPSGGLALEFGVFSGKTLRVIADARKDGRVYGFDSFEGLPEAWRAGFPAGAFATGTIPETPGAELVVGWFDATLPQFLVDHTDPVDFVHVDCDLYSSTKTVLDLIGRRLRPGSVLIFDEYFNYPGWQEHEHKAWMEYAERTGTRFVFEAYTYNNEQVTLRIVE